MKELNFDESNLAENLKFWSIEILLDKVYKKIIMYYIRYMNV